MLRKKLEDPAEKLLEDVIGRKKVKQQLERDKNKSRELIIVW